MVPWTGGEGRLLNSAESEWLRMMADFWLRSKKMEVLLSEMGLGQKGLSLAGSSVLSWH
jgi:hypothetical protein